MSWSTNTAKKMLEILHSEIDGASLEERVKNAFSTLVAMYQLKPGKKTHTKTLTEYNEKLRSMQDMGEITDCIFELSASLEATSLVKFALAPIVRKLLLIKSHSEKENKSDYLKKTKIETDKPIRKAFEELAMYETFIRYQPKKIVTLEEVINTLEVDKPCDPMTEKTLVRKSVDSFLESMRPQKFGILGHTLLYPSNEDYLASMYMSYKEDFIGKEQYLELLLGPEKDRAEIIPYALLCSHHDNFIRWFAMLENSLPIINKGERDRIIQIGSLNLSVEEEIILAKKLFFLPGLLSVDTRLFGASLKILFNEYGNLETGREILHKILTKDTNGLHARHYIEETSDVEKRMIYKNSLNYSIQLCFSNYLEKNYSVKNSDTLEEKNHKKDGLISGFIKHTFNIDLTSSDNESIDSMKKLLEIIFAGYVDQAPEEKMTVPNKNKKNKKKKSKNYQKAEQKIFKIETEGTASPENFLTTARIAYKHQENQFYQTSAHATTFAEKNKSYEEASILYLVAIFSTQDSAEINAQIIDFIGTATNAEAKYSIKQEKINPKEASKILHKINIFLMTLKKIAVTTGAFPVFNFGNIKFHKHILGVNTISSKEFKHHFELLREFFHRNWISDEMHNSLLLGDKAQSHQLMQYAVQRCNPEILSIWLKNIQQSTSNNKILQNNYNKLLLGELSEKGGKTPIDECTNTEGTLNVYLDSLQNAYFAQVLTLNEYELVLKSIRLSQSAPKVAKGALEFARNALAKMKVELSKPVELPTSEPPRKQSDQIKISRLEIIPTKIVSTTALILKQLPKKQIKPAAQNQEPPSQPAIQPNFICVIYPPEINNLFSELGKEKGSTTLFGGSILVSLIRAMEENILFNKLAPGTDLDFRGNCSKAHLEKLNFVKTNRTSLYRRHSPLPSVDYELSETKNERPISGLTLYVHSDSSGRVIDPSKRGVQDIRNKKVRTIQLPPIAFSADPILMLNALKYCFAPEFKFTLPPEERAAMQGWKWKPTGKKEEDASLIKRLSFALNDGFRKAGYSKEYMEELHRLGLVKKFTSMGVTFSDGMMAIIDPHLEREDGAEKTGCSSQAAL